jgi:hypothetical protein
VAANSKQRGGERELRQPPASRGGRPSCGISSKRSINGAHRNLNVYGNPTRLRKADGRDVDAFDAQPGLQRLAGERQRQAGCEAEHGDDEQIDARRPRVFAQVGATGNVGIARF